MSEKIIDISVLVVEDEKQVLEPMVEYLQLFFEDVYTARDGLNAFRIYERKKPDIIISDIHMPHMDGLTMIEKIREKDKKTKIIITTAHSEREKLLQAIKLHLVDYLIKPVQSDLLKEMLLTLVAELRQNADRVDLKEGYTWDSAGKILLHKSEEVALKEKEKKVLDLLCTHANQTVSVFDIYNHLYEDQPDREFSSNSITSLMKRIRPKLPADTISAVYGVGYILYTK